MAKSGNIASKGCCLQGKRIVVTAEEFERSEHRGIATYAKALLNSLKEKGAEVWLLSELDPVIKYGALRRLPSQTRELISSSYVLDGLAIGATDKLWSIERRFPWIKRASNIRKTFKKLIQLLTIQRKVGKSHMHKIELNKQFDNPYLRIERLKYLENIDGIICVKNIFRRSQWLSMSKHLHTISIDLEGFDALFITSPQNITATGVTSVVQTIHDLIPLEDGNSSPEQMISFTRRLQACNSNHRLFVSRSTAKKYHQHIGTYEKSTQKPLETIIVQPPSLQTPDWTIGSSNTSSDLEPCTQWLIPRGRAEKNSLSPFRYMLFNSSVDPRKNLLFLITAYIESNLSCQDIKLCITGKFKKDDYSKRVQTMIKQDSSILLTGYVSENQKLDLYLNAMALLSPSLVEGFGIPVLDAACLGLTALASDSDSHLEIQAMEDFADWVVIAKTLESRDWAIAMQAISFKNAEIVNDIRQERKRRLRRYNQLKTKITEKFGEQISTMVN